MFGNNLEMENHKEIVADTKFHVLIQNVKESKKHVKTQVTLSTEDKRKDVNGEDLKMVKDLDVVNGFQLV